MKNNKNKEIKKKRRRRNKEKKNDEAGAEGGRLEQKENSKLNGEGGERNRNPAQVGLGFFQKIIKEKKKAQKRERKKKKTDHRQTRAQRPKNTITAASFSAGHRPLTWK